MISRGKSVISVKKKFYKVVFVLKTKLMLNSFKLELEPVYNIFELFDSAFAKTQLAVFEPGTFNYRVQRL